MQPRTRSPTLAGNSEAAAASAAVGNNGNRTRATSRIPANPILIIIPFILTIFFILAQLDVAMDRFNDYDPYNDRQLAAGIKHNKLKKFLEAVDAQARERQAVWGEAVSRKEVVADVVSRIRALVAREKKTIVDGNAAQHGGGNKKNDNSGVAAAVPQIDNNAAAVATAAAAIDSNMISFLAGGSKNKTLDDIALQEYKRIKALKRINRKNGGGGLLKSRRQEEEEEQVAIELRGGVGSDADATPITRPRKPFDLDEFHREQAIISKGKKEALEYQGPFSAEYLHGPVIPGSEDEQKNVFSQFGIRRVRGMSPVEETMPAIGMQQLGEDYGSDGLPTDKTFDRDISWVYDVNNFEGSSSSSSNSADDEAAQSIMSSPSSLSGNTSSSNSQRKRRRTNYIVMSDQATIFISVAAYRDEYCSPTVASVFSQARFPERVFVGVVRQQETADPYRCISANYQYKIQTAAPQQQQPSNPASGGGSQVAASSPSSRPSDDLFQCPLAGFCPLDNIRIRFQFPTGAKGPTYGRYVSMLMYQGEQFAMIIDSHTLFAPRWDVLMIQEVWLTTASGLPIGTSDSASGAPTKKGKKAGAAGENAVTEPGAATTITANPFDNRKPKRFVKIPMGDNQGGDNTQTLIRRGGGGGKGVVISHYPPAFHGFNRDVQFGPLSRHLTVMCTAHYLKDTQTYGLIRMDGSNLAPRVDPKNPRHRVPRLQPFTAAGFLFGDAAYLADVPFDPYLDFMFDGEEILYSVRLWTHGYDSYSPSEAVVAHIYGRAKAHRVWSVANNMWWKHQAEAHVRFHYFMETYHLITPTTFTTKAADFKHPATGVGAELLQASAANQQLSPLPKKRVVEMKELVAANKDKEAVRYGMGHWRELSDYYTFASIDRNAWDIKSSC